MTVLSIERANTTAFKTFSNSHEELGNVLKIVSVGLSLTIEEIQNGTPAKSLWSRVGALSEHWGTVPIFTQEIAETAYAEVANLGLARSFSAFDRYLSDIGAELDSIDHYHSSQPVALKSGPDDDSGGLDNPGMAFERFCERQNFSRLNVEFVAPVFDYYRAARNCIIHRSGVASRELETKVISASLSESLANWEELTNEHGPLKLKSFEEGEPIRLDYFDAILCSSILRRLALDIDAQVIRRMGIEGLTLLAAKRYMKRCQIGATNLEHSTAPKAIASYLSRVNRVVGVGWKTVEPQLNRLGILKDLNRAFEGKR
ncbi:hypothetical protein [Pseudohalocynthiibacter sp. F2068]|uniref:hypothetical protein n=1 Tax=Pseudohalocynthiibacter sp. F2068 TaxID=2926418 RepID=UPI001FF6E5B4|nr:hypothetical protein [Pseudohalocynthiibacter sp. F2068]MCK0101974.1 hypothetical protein [Pseudohalocynthiibacter sp. F2068]